MLTPAYVHSANLDAIRVNLAHVQQAFGSLTGMKRTSQILIGAALAAMTSTAFAATPEIQRQTGTPQADGIAHTLRTIPEACGRIEGVFTGTAAKPYAIKAVKTNPACQPRARLVDAGKVGAKDGAKGWALNDVIKVPSKSCPAQMAIVTVYRQIVNNETYKLDAQGRARVYIKDDAQKAYTAKDAKRTIPTYAVATAVEGKSCK